MNMGSVIRTGCHVAEKKAAGRIMRVLGVIRRANKVAIAKKPRATGKPSSRSPKKHKNIRAAISSTLNLVRLR